ncbi:MAG: peptidoglycan-binding domain-containing protein [Actinomycetota bacterium]|nr:peptidoglycan-binding domain-containing protein [Actinomycetota bacterium]
MRRFARAVVAVAVGVLLVAVGWWAGRAAFVAPEDPLVEAVPVEYAVEIGSVGRSLSFAAVAEWPLVDLGRGAAVGTVTSIDVEPGAAVASGDVLYSVDLRPVVIAEGAVPSFRDLALKAEGPDVAQLQGLLVVEGFFEGEVDGVFGRGTRTAVREWQESVGVKVDGVVRRGDVVFADGLAARVVLGSEVVVGAELSGSEVTVRRVAGDPVFVIPLALEQRDLVPLTAAVEVSHAGGVWHGVIAAVVEDDLHGQLHLVLEADGGGALCGLECAEVVPLEGRSDYPAKIVVVPETTGPMVPVAAIATGPDGSTFVRMAGGGETLVVVVAVSNGLAVVEGVSPGDVILLPVTEES